MNKWVKVAGILGSAVTIGFLGVACSWLTPPELKNYQGKWVDVNSRTTLDFKGSSMTVNYTTYKETYKVKAEASSGVTYIKNTESLDGFGSMSEIQVCDGYLSAFEMLLDAEGHKYRFVREDQLESEKVWRDMSKDLPKTIQSKEITRFSLNFKKLGTNYGLDNKWPNGYYSWEVDRNSDGTYHMNFVVINETVVALDYSEDVKEEVVAGLAERIVSLGIPEYNGFSMVNNVDYYGYFLYTTYETGEKLVISAEGDPGRECVFDLAGLLSYAEEIGILKYKVY